MSNNIKNVLCCEEDDQISSFEFVVENHFPMPSGGSIGRKSVDQQSSSKTRMETPYKIPGSAEDKVGTIPYFKGFVLAKGTVYYQFTSGGRYSKVAYRLIISNSSYDTVGIPGIQQYFYLSATGNNVAHVTTALKLGRTYECYNFKFYKVSETIKIGNFKQGAYANEVMGMVPGTAEFQSNENFGSNSTLKGVVVDVCLASYCNCAVLCGPSNGQTFISDCRKCNGCGIMLLNDDGEEQQREGNQGHLTLVNIETDTGNVPVQLLVHPNFTESKLDDIVLEVGAQIEGACSRMLNSRNLSVMWEIVCFRKKNEVHSAKEAAESGGIQGESAEAKIDVKIPECELKSENNF